MKKDFASVCSSSFSCLLVLYQYFRGFVEVIMKFGVFDKRYTKVHNGASHITKHNKMNSRPYPWPCPVEPFHLGFPLAVLSVAFLLYRSKVEMH